MREDFRNQLAILHTELIRMGAFCEDAIASAVKGLLDEDTALREKALTLETDINQKEREIEDFCLRLLIREQPVAGDLRLIHAAQKMIANMERIGDQAADIAEISAFMAGSEVKSDVHIADMARAAVKMLQDSIDSFVVGDVGKAQTVIAYDDVVDDLFLRVKSQLVERISKNSDSGGACLDLLMIAKYLERIGDHAVNIAEQIVYAVTGKRVTP
ncbi:phosphate signaling complex protein PhoU [Oscillospiraceae bacterium OttesenSCG-928-G22]|nr:phosphate signaling complex protein PhoU [Oscillospiraceae bacterium OttesenSCG-928-G22]